MSRTHDRDGITVEAVAALADVTTLIARLPGVRALADRAAGALRDAVAHALPTEIFASEALTEPSLLLDVEGRFWDPATSHRQVRGRLQWGRQKGTLALEEPLRLPRHAQDPLQRIVGGGRDELPVIAGRSVFGERLCLVDCFVHQMTGARVQHPQTWTVNETLIGVDVPPELINGLELRIPAMRGFYGDPLVDVPQRGPAGPRQKVTIEWQSSPEVIVELDNLRLIFDDDWELSGDARGVRLRATPRVRMLSSEPTPATVFDRLVGPLIVLMAICLGRDVEVDETRLLLDGDQQARRLVGLRVVLAPTAELRPWLGVGNLSPQQRTFERWFAFAEELPIAVAMVAEYLRGGVAKPSEEPLLYLARFIEQYHRVRYDSLRLPKKVFAGRRNAVRDTVSGELGDWVYGLLGYANERALAERVQELVDIHAGVLGAALGPNSASFAQTLANTRNYYTHYSKGLEAKAARELQLIVLTDRVWALVRACLLHELGFTPTESAQMLGLDPRLGWLSKQP